MTAPARWKAQPSSNRRRGSRSTPCSPTTAWPSPICPRIATAQPPLPRPAHLRPRLHGKRHRAPVDQPYHPWTNGQAERMNRTIKDATIKTYHYDDFENLKAHITAFVTAYNFAKHLKALKWRTHIRSSARPGPNTRQSSSLTRATSCRDHTPRPPAAATTRAQLPDRHVFPPPIPPKITPRPWTPPGTSAISAGAHRPAARGNSDRRITSTSNRIASPITS